MSTGIPQRQGTSVAKGDRKSGHRLAKPKKPTEELVLRLDGLSRQVNAELKTSLARQLQRKKPEAIGSYMDRGKSTINDWASKKEPPIPATKLVYFGIADPDPEALNRIAHLILEASAAIAADRQRRGGSVSIIHSAELDFGGGE